MSQVDHGDRSRVGLGGSAKRLRVLPRDTPPGREEREDTDAREGGFGLAVVGGLGRAPCNGKDRGVYETVARKVRRLASTYGLFQGDSPRIYIRNATYFPGYEPSPPSEKGQ